MKCLTVEKDVPFCESQTNRIKMAKHAKLAQYFKAASIPPRLKSDRTNMGFFKKCYI